MTDPTYNGRLLRRLCWGVRIAPLITPYELSFTQLTAFVVVWVSAEDQDGRIGIGEAVALPGYNWETTETIRAAVAAICEDADGAAVSTIVERCRAAKRDHPFASSAVMSALDMPLYLANANASATFPLSAPVSGDWPISKLRETVEAYLSKGYKFIKVKVGRDFDGDVKVARWLLTKRYGEQYRVVFDSNQAYTPDAALAFTEILRDCASERLQWLEQPVDRRDWDGMERLCRDSRVPIVLDESIYDAGDIERAAAIGAYGVKLKLIKNFGIAETLSLARYARSHDLIVVFGNGVASDIGNLGEYLTLAGGEELFAVPAECTGFVKLRESLLGSVLTIDADGQFGCAMPAERLAGRMREFTDLSLSPAEPIQRPASREIQA